MPVAFEKDPWDLTWLMDTEQVEPYQDEGYIKYYQKGGPLEWYAAPNFPPGCIQKSEGDEDGEKILIS